MAKYRYYYLSCTNAEYVEFRDVYEVEVLGIPMVAHAPVTRMGRKQRISTAGAVISYKGIMMYTQPADTLIKTEQGMVEQCRLRLERNLKHPDYVKKRSDILQLFTDRFNRVKVRGIRTRREVEEVRNTIDWSQLPATIINDVR